MRPLKNMIPIYRKLEDAASFETTRVPKDLSECQSASFTDGFLCIVVLRIF